MFDSSTKTWKRRLPDADVSDVIGNFTIYKNSKDYPDKLRKLIVKEHDDGIRNSFLKNNLEVPAKLISPLYQIR